MGLERAAVSAPLEATKSDRGEFWVGPSGLLETDRELTERRRDKGSDARRSRGGRRRRTSEPGRSAAGVRDGGWLVRLEAGLALGAG